MITAAENSDKSPGGHNFVEPAFELFVCGDFIQKRAVDKPHFVCLPHDRVEAVEGEGLSAIDRCFGLVFAHARRLVHQESLFSNLRALDRCYVNLKTFLSCIFLERDRQCVAAFVPFLRRDVGWVMGFSGIVEKTSGADRIKVLFDMLGVKRLSLYAKVRLPPLRTSFGGAGRARRGDGAIEALGDRVRGHCRHGLRGKRAPSFGPHCRANAVAGLVWLIRRETRLAANEPAIAAPVFIGAPSFTPGGSSLGYGEPVVMPTESALTAPPAAPAKPSPSKPVLNAPVVARSGDETKAQMARVNGDKSAFYQYLRPAGREPWRK